MEFATQISNKGDLLEGILLLKPKVYKDSRGLFLESWNSRDFKKTIQKEVEFVQDNHSSSLKGVLRGLHYQKSPFSQGKLIRCSHGKIFDVAVDIRKDSKTFSQWVGVILDSFNHYQLWIPRGFAHGFLTLSESAEVSYKTDQYWMQEFEESIRWDDPRISIEWPNINHEYILSDKDNKASLIDYIIQSDLF